MLVVFANMKKNHRLPFPLFESRASHPFTLVHADLWDPATIISTTSASYFLLFHDFFQFSSLHPLHTKDQALPTFVKFKTLVENQFNSWL